MSSSSGMILPRIEGFSREILYFVEVVTLSLIATCITCQCCRSSQNQNQNQTRTRRRRRNRVSMCCRTFCNLKFRIFTHISSKTRLAFNLYTSSLSPVIHLIIQTLNQAHLHDNQQRSASRRSWKMP